MSDGVIAALNKPKPAGFGLPDRGALILIPSEGVVATVTGVKQLAKGRRLTLMWATGAYTAENETHVITELPEGWVEIDNATAFEKLS